MSTARVWDLTGRRNRRVYVAQAEVSVCFLAAAFLCWEGASDLRRPAIGWQGWSWPLATAAVGFFVSAALPWVWSGVTVRVQRVVSWASIAVGAVVVTAGMAVIDLTAALGIQLGLGGAILAEMGSRRSASRWFWGTALAIWAAFFLYQAAVGLRPEAD